MNKNAETKLIELKQLKRAAETQATNLGEQISKLEVELYYQNLPIELGSKWVMANGSNGEEYVLIKVFIDEPWGFGYALIGKKSNSTYSRVRVGMKIEEAFGGSRKEFKRIA